MRSISLILSAKVCCSLLAAVCWALPALADGENYSLWPQRPESLEQARRLMDAGKLEEAVALLQPLVLQGGMTGREAKDIIGGLRIRQVLNPNGPDVKKYTVRSGDNWTKIVKRTGCSPAMLVHLNSLMSWPPYLRAGEVLKYRPLDFRVVVNVPEKEICLYDGENFVKAYPIAAMNDSAKKNAETHIREEQASKGAYEALYAAVDKTLLLAAGGYVIEPANGSSRAPGFFLSRQDCNELAMLTRAGNKVSIIREKEKGVEP